MFLSAVTDCSHRSTSMLIILVEVSMEVACQSTTATACRHMLLILVEVSVKVACRSTTATECSHRAITMPFILAEVSVKVACRSTRAKTAGTELSPYYLF